MASCDKAKSTEIAFNISRNTEMTATNALKRIQSLYKEIMCPINDNQEEMFVTNEENTVPISKKKSKLSFHLKSQNSTFICNECLDEHNKICKFCKETICCDSCNNLVSIHDKKYLVTNSKMTNRKKDISKRTFRKKKILQDDNCDENSSVAASQPSNQNIREEQRRELKTMKLNKLRDEVNESIEKELNIKIRRNPIPKHIYLPLYQNIVEQNERRKKERKENLEEKFKTLVKPFHLSTSKSPLRKTKSSLDLTCEESKAMFKAKPVPKHILSNQISEKLKQKEEVRKILIAHRAEETLKESSLPFSVKKINRSLSLLNLDKLQKEKNSEDKSRRNNDAVSKNIYNYKCKEAMENWSQKVIQTNLSKQPSEDKIKAKEKLNNYINNSKKFLTSSQLPFFNLPVRMSAASMLREKQIRTNIFALKCKEEQERIENDEKIRKERELKKNLWPKLHRMDPTSDTNKIIEEKIKTYKSSQISREQEYAKELQEIMERVGNQLLLIERQTKEINSNPIKKLDSVEDCNSSASSPPEACSDDEISQNADTANSTTSISSPDRT